MIDSDNGIKLVCMTCLIINSGGLKSWFADFITIVK
jgi:hypothetical protein